MKKKIALSLATAVGCMLMATSASAEIVTGYAAIEQNNIAKAREDARRDAMRSYVEAKIGVHVNSESETVNYVLTRDRVLAQSDGYVLVKKVVKESAANGIMSVTLDLAAGVKPIEVSPEDTKSYLRSLSTDSARYGLDIAVVDKSGSMFWTNYMSGKLTEAGFDAHSNGAVLDYLGRNMQLNDFQLNAELRRIGNFDRQGNALIRGRIDSVRAAENVGGGLYRAVAEITANIVGYDSNNMDAVSKYAEGIARTPEEAERKAKENVIDEAVKVLAQQSILTDQVMTKGGNQNIIAQLRFDRISNPAADREAVKQAAINAGCRVRTCAIMGNYIALAVHSSQYGNLNDLVDGIIAALKPNYGLVYPEMINTVGSTQYIIHLRG